MLLEIKDIREEYRKMLALYYQIRADLKANLFSESTDELAFSEGMNKLSELVSMLAGSEIVLKMEPFEIKEEHELMGRKFLGPQFQYTPSPKSRIFA
jgi:hypothetical protein